MTTTTPTAEERLALYRAEVPVAQAAFDRTVAAMLSVGSDVTHNLRLLGEEVSDGVLTTALDNIEHLAHLADRAREARDRLADVVFMEDAARQEIEEERRYQAKQDRPTVTFPSGWIGERNGSWIAWAKANPSFVLDKDRDKVPS